MEVLTHSSGASRMPSSSARPTAAAARLHPCSENWPWRPTLCPRGVPPRLTRPGFRAVRKARGDEAGEQELLVVATNTDPQAALANCRRQLAIETLFAACRTRGLNLEDSHLIHPERIAKLIAVLALAFISAHATGAARHRPIIIKTHKRKAQSIFRVGFDRLRKILVQGDRNAVQCWNAIMTGQSPDQWNSTARPNSP